MNKIVWLASYPKSGNTWVRIFLNNYLLNGEAPADINKMPEGLHSSTRALFDRLTGVESSDLTPTEIDQIRPFMYQRWAKESSETLFVKVHDAWRRNDGGESLFPGAATKTAVYIIRNPLDIVASLANHYSLSLDEAISTLADESYALASSVEKLNRQLPQFVGSWHAHVTSWANQREMPLHLIRYEQLCCQPEQTFKQLIQAVGLPFDLPRLEKAIRFSSFDQLKQQETAVGFAERRPNSPMFFRQGKSGGWQHELSQNQIATVCNNHRNVMQQFGYLNEEDQPIISND
ncbi:sulfotransferase domain-containing protein [Candidatus Leptofilum sp.]|uniref:sulfotransferase domain-containing protein n=1 Tax=Candidatus Leptofilum sp. TaxID=3241576 RepID=UPI003B5BE439